MTMNRLRTFLLCGAFALAFSLRAAGQEGEPPAGKPDRVGDASFPVSCSPAAQQAFNRAVAILHSFFYQAAAGEFRRVTELDPACAMGHWGIAMSSWYPLWFPPSPALLKQGADAVEAARRIGAKSERERGWLAAIAAFYRDSDTLDHRARALAYEQAMEQLHQNHPNDREAAAFYALALLAAADPSDKTHARQLASAAILEQLYAAQPDHPGVAHYLIHAYDYPGLAERALPAARRYGRIAPSVPHALHMPSHTFTYVGRWRESIESNRAAGEAAKRTHWVQEELHTMDYLVYAYLQLGDARAAQRVLADMRALRLDDKERSLVTDYALAASPARHAIELKRWSDAAALAPRASRFPATEAITHFARALGAAHRGDAAAARGEVDALARLSDALVQAKQDYWAGQVDVQRQAAAAWLAWAAGDRAAALAQMRAAAIVEDSTYKHPVTPAPIVPARELLGDLLVELGRPRDALAEYEAALRALPNRRNGLAGAAHAAQLAGERDKAAHYAAQLRALAPDDARDRATRTQALAAPARN